MARPKERQVTTGQPVNTELAQVSRQRAAQTTRAMGGTRVAGWIPNSNRASQLAKAFGVLSGGLLSASRTATDFAEQDKAIDAEIGKKKALNPETTYEDMESRGMQEGYLQAKGKAEGLAFANKLQDYYSRG